VPAAGQLRVCVAGIVAAAIAVAAVAVVGLAPAGAAPARGGAGATLSPAQGTRCGVQEKAAFKPKQVVEGLDTHLVVVLHNCTGSAHKLNLIEYGIVVCLVADPLVRPITLRAGQTRIVRTEYRAPSCTGRGRIVATVTSSSGKQLATRTARFTVVAPPATT
jgi:hypothetical protein